MKIEWYIEMLDEEGKPDGSTKTYNTEGVPPAVGDVVYFNDYSLERGMGTARYVVTSSYHVINRRQVEMDAVMSKVPRDVKDPGERFEAAIKIIKAEDRGVMSTWNISRRVFICDEQIAQVTLRLADKQKETA